ncbi:FkbM family methyltransferase [Pukyongiella litopenaei]|uniref:FkbM family methyltransferase n=1 Tax=Pukyongiella litopenaei TaxID=2605946 RepID=UPI001B809080|nr:FkbM family methyltransferase [Pukyongiella litopenaei]
MLDYDSVIETQGVQIPFVPRIITPKIERPMRNNRYEGGEVASLRRLLKPGDRVLELGAGVGLCSTIAAQNPDVDRVVAIEANPDMIPLIQETYRLNDVCEQAELRNGVATVRSGAEIPFYIRQDFWGSSMEAESRPFARVEQVPALAIDDLLAEVRPTVLVCDIEGGELGLFDDADLSSVRNAILELHPKVYGRAGSARIVAALARKGLYLSPENKPDSSVQIFERRPPPQPIRTRSALKTGSDRWYGDEPRTLITTCMKDEGPFILEWVAWHKALGITDLVVFTNDCSDGTDLILNRLQQIGVLTHLPNPAVVAGQTVFQPIALAYTQLMPIFSDVDFVISMDVDEFVNIRAGDGRLTDLFDAAGPFDALSIFELNHGCNGQVKFEPGLMRDQFPGHSTETPGKWRAHRGAKTITRISSKLVKLRNHRPDMDAGANPVWLDGSAQPFDEFQSDSSLNGADARGRYNLVVLDHYALRSMESYFMKMLRGDVVVAGKRVSLRYWRLRNKSEARTSTPNPALVAAANAFHETHFAGDPELMALHDQSCRWHSEQIERISEQQEIKDRRDWIMENAWT